MSGVGAPRRWLPFTVSSESGSSGAVALLHTTASWLPRRLCWQWSESCTSRGKRPGWLRVHSTSWSRSCTSLAEGLVGLVEPTIPVGPPDPRLRLHPPLLLHVPPLWQATLLPSLPHGDHRGSCRSRSRSRGTGGRRTRSRASRSSCSSRSRRRSSRRRSSRRSSCSSSLLQQPHLRHLSDSHGCGLRALLLSRPRALRLMLTESTREHHPRHGPQCQAARAPSQDELPGQGEARRQIAGAFHPQLHCTRRLLELIPCTAQEGLGGHSHQQPCRHAVHADHAVQQPAGNG